MYREILSQMPSQPEVRTASSGIRALAKIESEPFRLMVCDLRMPKMDGLQVLAIVRRKFPELRTVALTSVEDEQFRSRAYALGVDSRAALVIGGALAFSSTATVLKVLVERGEMVARFGRVSVAVDGTPPAFWEAIGYPAAGPRAVRVDR